MGVRGLHLAKAEIRIEKAMNRRANAIADLQELWTPLISKSFVGVQFFPSLHVSPGRLIVQETIRAAKLLRQN